MELNRIYEEALYNEKGFRTYGNEGLKSHIVNEYKVLVGGVETDLISLGKEVYVGKVYLNSNGTGSTAFLDFRMYYKGEVVFLAGRRINEGRTMMGCGIFDRLTVKAQAAAEASLCFDGIKTYKE